jgi:hypothetical protein
LKNVGVDATPHLSAAPSRQYDLSRRSAAIFIGIHVKKGAVSQEKSPSLSLAAGKTVPPSCSSRGRCSLAFLTTLLNGGLANLQMELTRNESCHDARGSFEPLGCHKGCFNFSAAASSAYDWEM